MQIIRLEDVPERFDEMLAAATTGPVHIQNGEQVVGVVISPEDHEELLNGSKRLRFDRTTPGSGSPHQS